MNKPKINQNKRDGIYRLRYYLNGERKTISLKTRDYTQAIANAAQYGYTHTDQYIPTVQTMATAAEPQVEYIYAVNKYLSAQYHQPNAWTKGFPIQANGSGNASEGACALSCLKYFQAFSGIKSINQITYPLLQDFIDLNKGKYGNNTLNKYRNRLRKFVHFCFKNDWVIKNEADKLDSLKKDKVDRFRFSDEEVDLVLSSKHCTKYKTFFEFMLETGLRACDTWFLSRGNFRVEKDGHMYMNVNMVKVDRPLDVPLSDRAREIVETSGPMLFPWVNTEGQYEPVKAIKRAFGVAGSAGAKFCKKHGITLHVFRHTFAMRLRERDVPKADIQQFLGHTSVTTTEIYANMKDPSGLVAHL